MSDRAAGRISDQHFHAAEDAALRDTIARLEETGSPVISDGEQTKPSFATYPITGLSSLAADGAVIEELDMLGPWDGDEHPQPELAAEWEPGALSSIYDPR